jgi:hypothetical protein
VGLSRQLEAGGLAPTGLLLDRRTFPGPLHATGPLSEDGAPSSSVSRPRFVFEPAEAHPEKHGRPRPSGVPTLLEPPDDSGTRDRSRNPGNLPNAA